MGQHPELPLYLALAEDPLLILPTELTGTVGEMTAWAAVGRDVTLQTCPDGNISLL